MPARRWEDDEDDAPPPRRRGDNSSAIAWIIAGSVGAFLALILVVIVLNGQRERREAREAEELAREEAQARAEERAQAFRPAQPNWPPPNNPPAPEPPPWNGPPPLPPPPPRKGKPFPRPPALPPELTESNASGALESREKYREFRTDGSLLIGFEIGTDTIAEKTVVAYLRPIYRTPAGAETFGTAYGRTNEPLVTAKAEEGYAIGELAVRRGRFLEGIRFTFMKVVPGGLNPTDKMQTAWFGTPPKEPAKPPLEPKPDEVKPLVVGIHGTRFEDTEDDAPETNGAIGTIGFVQVPLRDKFPGFGPGSVELPIPRPLPPGWQRSKTLGSTSRELEFSEVRTEGSLLLGFEVGTDLKYFRPIWLTPNGTEDFGTEYGKKAAGSVTLKAKDGYAVSGMVVSSFMGSRIDGFALTFAKRLPKKGLSTTAKDTYTSPWVGEPGRKNGAERLSAQGGYPITGFHGQRFSLAGNGGEIQSIGLVVPNKPDGWQIAQSLEKLPGLKPERTKAPGPEQGPEQLTLGAFESAAPPGGWLVGFEVTIGKEGNAEAIDSLRAMFLTGDKPSDGRRCGKWFTDPNKARYVRVLAKPGYAVGGLTVRTGTAVEGFSVTFMKVKGNRLDPRDTYESEWIGNRFGNRATVVSDGAPVVGYWGRSDNFIPMMAIGLLVESAEGK